MLYDSFSILSIISPSFLAVSKLLVIVNHVDSKFKRTLHIVKWLLSIYILSLVFTLMFTLTFKNTIISLPVLLCFPFIDLTKSEKILNVVTISFSVSHFGTFYFNNTIIFYSCSKSERNTKEYKEI